MRTQSGPRNVLVLGVTFVLLLASSLQAGEVTSGADLKFWGRAVFNMHYDTALLAQDFLSYITDDTQEEFNFNPRDTRLGFSASQVDGDWTYRGVFEMDFYGDNAGNNLLPRLRLGYAEAKNSGGLSIRGGQDWIPIAQQNPATIDFGVLSWSGNLWWRVPQMTVRYQSGNLEFLASAMKHRISTDQETQEKMPWLIGRVAANDVLGKGSLLALGGAYRSVTVDDNEYAPYLFAGELKLPFGTSGIELTAEAYLGAGVGREYVHYGFDYNATHADGPTEIASLGGFASLVVPVSPKIDLAAGFGMDDPDDDDLAGAAAVPYLKNSTFFGTFKYKVTDKFGWGLEVCQIMTDTGAADDLTGQRFTTSWWFVF